MARLAAASACSMPAMPTWLGIQQKLTDIPAWSKEQRCSGLWWRPSERLPARSLQSKPPLGAAGGGFDTTERTETRSDGRRQG